MNTNIKKVEVIQPNSIVESKKKIKKKRVCAYCRVSTDMEEQLKSYNSQMEYYNRYINSKEGWLFAGIYISVYFEDENIDTMTMNGELPKYLIRNHHEAIIDHETFDKVKQLRAERSRRTTDEQENKRKRYSSKFSFSGKAVCGYCGSNLTRRTRQARV